jgi:hypothetical protein
MCLVGMAGSDAVVRLVDKSQGQKAKNCESDPTHCLPFFMTKVLSTTPAGFWFQPEELNQIEQPQKVVLSTTPAGLVSTGGTKPTDRATTKSPY